LNGIVFSKDAPLRHASGSFSGEVLPAWRALLFGPEGLRLDQWLRDGQARLIKQGPRRAVYRVDAAQHRFFVKHYRCPRWWQALAHLFRRSPSRREFARARETLKRQVPTAEAVAWLESRRRGLVYDSFLVTRAIEDGYPLDDYVRTQLPRLDRTAAARMRRKFAVGLAKLSAAAHRGGLDHDDLHAGNILVRIAASDTAGGEGSPELYLIDLPGVRLSRSLGWRSTLASLTMLGASCLMIATSADVSRFWRAYLAERPELAGRNPRQLARHLARAIARRRRRVARHRDKRALRSNRDFYRRRNGQLVAAAVSDFPPHQLARLLESPRQPLESNFHRPYKLSHRSLVVQAELPLDSGPTRVAYKRVRPRNWSKTVLHYFLRSPAWRAWYHGHALLLRGIATARPLAIVERRRFGLPCEAFLVTQWVEGADNLHVYAWRLQARPAVERLRRTRQVAASLGCLLGRMHAWHVSHRDLKACNILVVEQPDLVECYLIDADSVSIPRRLSPFFRAFNLGRLATSLEAHKWIKRTDRLRFFRAYLSELHRRDAGAWPSDYKQGWRAVSRATQRIIGRLKRGGREIV
jgi:tRNA A-37 threonylcarbamoyl transferase component Bud32